MSKQKNFSIQVRPALFKRAGVVMSINSIVSGMISVRGWASKLLFVVLCLLALPANADQAGDEWSFTVAPYAWLAGG